MHTEETPEAVEAEQPAEDAPVAADAEEQARSFELQLGPVEVRDLAKREIDVRIVPWNTAIETVQGRELFEPGAFDGIDAGRVLLYPANHEVRMGLGQDGRVKPVRPAPAGKGLRLWNGQDGGYGTFRVARTQAGDEILALAADGIVTGISAEFSEVPGGSAVESRDGRRTRIHRRVALSGISPTPTPAYAEAGLVAMRSQEAPVSEITPVETSSPVVNVDLAPVVTAMREQSETLTSEFRAALEQMTEESRKLITPPPAAAPVKVAPWQWLAAQLYRMAGDELPANLRTIADVTASDNSGLIPPAQLADVIGVIEASRPFLSTTRRVNAPAEGTSIVVPKLTQRSAAGVQGSEKSEVASAAMQSTPTTFNMVTIAGAVDVSLQFLRRSSPIVLQMLWDDMAQAYADASESQAIAALLDENVVQGNATFDPEALQLGETFANAYTAMRRGPDTIWLSTTAIGAFIDAKTNLGGANLPLYGSIAANATAAGGVAGSISGLRAVHVPALEGSGVDAIVGPAAGFAWAEDGTYQLSVDKPTLAGRDMGLVGFLFAMPRYPGAFTTYSLAGS